MICPHCGSQKVYEVKERIDIGVGEIEHFIGYDCDGCGESFDTAKQEAFKNLLTELQESVYLDPED